MSSNINELKELFWEYKWESVKKNLKSPFVISRVLELGDTKQFFILLSYTGSKVIKQFVLKKGKRLLHPLSYNFWKLYFQNK